MIEHPDFTIEGWSVRELGLHLDTLPQTEPIFALSNGQTAINVTNGKLILLLVDDEPFDVRYGEVKDHERELDLRNGIRPPKRRRV